MGPCRERERPARAVHRASSSNGCGETHEEKNTRCGSTTLPPRHLMGAEEPEEFLLDFRDGVAFEVLPRLVAREQALAIVFARTIHAAGN